MTIHSLDACTALGHIYTVTRKQVLTSLCAQCLFSKLALCAYWQTLTIHVLASYHDCRLGLKFFTLQCNVMVNIIVYSVN